MPYALDDTNDDLDESLEPEEIEDDTLDEEAVDNGEICGHCGGQFAKEQGEASFCPDCWTATTDEEHKGYVRANSDVL